MIKRGSTKLILCLAVMAGFLTACQGKSQDTAATAESGGQSAFAGTEHEETQASESVQADGETRSYLTGLPIEEGQQNKRPIAVMMNNIKEGCPQAGIEKASIIYEAPVEGRITRLMGIFENWTDIEKIGYIRSSRDYFVYCALEYDAIYCHFGQATVYVGDLLNSDRVDNISAAVAGISRPAQHAYHRTEDRRMPHNVVTNGPDILEYVEKFGYSQEYHDSFQPKFQFVDSDEKDIYQDMPDVAVIYPGGETDDKPNGYSYVQAGFEYRDGKYYRYEYGGPHIDEETGDQLCYENVILQYCNGEVRDSNDYLAFGCHGDAGFPVQVFTRGKVVSGTWTRNSDNDPAVYVDEDGKPIRLTQGKTWICIVWLDYAQDVVLKGKSTTPLQATGTQSCGAAKRNTLKCMGI